MAAAMALNLPAALEKVGDVLQMTQTKDAEGAKLMKEMAKPVRKRDGSLEWRHGDKPSPLILDRLGAYCDQDIRTETELDGKVSRLPDAEQKIWELDQLINDRGFPLDVPRVMRAIDVVEFAKRRAAIRIRELTDGLVEKPTQLARIVEWINSQGIQCTSFRKSDHDDLLFVAAMDGNSKVKQVINLRRGTAKTSTAKFQKMLDCACGDDRARGQFAFDGAGQTGRWAGRLIQPQNLVRIDWERDGAAVSFALWCLGEPWSIEETYDALCLFQGEDHVLTLLSLCLRAMIVAEDGHVLFGADFSNIEGRMNAWLADEEWKLDAFKAYDAKTGPDLYKLAYATSFGVDVNSVGKGKERQIGKVQELALGYQGGVGAYVTMGDTYGVEPHELVEPVRKATDPELWETVWNNYESATDKHGLPIDQWTAIKIIVRGWRKAHPKLVAHWYELEDAVVAAVSNPGEIYYVYNGKCRYVFDGSFLLCELPSGRVIAYPEASLRAEVTEQVQIGGRWQNVDEFFPHEIEELHAQGAKFWKRTRYSVSFMGVDPETKQWRPQHLYGGHLCENIVQAAAADVLRAAMLRVEANGFPIILHAHDEILSHVQIGSDLEKFKASMLVTNLPWIKGLPLAVSGFEDKRYVK